MHVALWSVEKPGRQGAWRVSYVYKGKTYLKPNGNVVKETILAVVVVFDLPVVIFLY